MNEKCVDVLIVGGGLSGIAAAREVLKRCPTASVRVLEANDRVGGRTVADQDGTDLGGAYIGPTQDRIMSMVDACGLQLFPMDMSGKSIQYFNGTSRAYSGLIPPLNPISVVDLGHLVALLDRYQADVDLKQPMLSPRAVEWDAITVEQFLQNNSSTEDARNALRIAVKVVLATDAAEISLLSFLWYIRNSGGVRRILETEGGAQDSKVVGGTGNISVVAASQLPPGTIVLNAPIRLVDYTKPDVIEVFTSSGTCFFCKRLILAIPPVQQLRIEYHPPLNPSRVQSLQRYPMGHAIKTFVEYRTPFWRAKGLNGTAVCDRGISCVCFEDVKPDGAHPTLMGFVVADQAAQFCEATPDQRLKLLTEHYAKVFGSDEALRPVGYKEKVWASEPWVGGCYVALMGPNVITKYKMAFREPIDQRIFIAGTEAAYLMVGYMDGAVEAGERAARNALVTLDRIPAENNYDVVSMPDPSPQMPCNSMELSFWEKHIPSVACITNIAMGVVLACLACGVASRHKHMWCR